MSNMLHFDRGGGVGQRPKTRTGSASTTRAARFGVALGGKMVGLAYTKIDRTSGHDPGGPWQVQTHSTRLHTAASAQGS